MENRSTVNKSRVLVQLHSLGACNCAACRNTKESQCISNPAPGM